MQQIWKDVLDYEGLYQVSNLGRVKSLGNNKSRKEKILKNKITIRKYKRKDYKITHICLYKNAKTKTFLVSRLVYSAFKGKIPSGYQVDHKDNNQQNNHLDNLQLLTCSENNKKRYIDNPNYKSNGGLKQKRIICLNDGLIYESINEASRKLNLFRFSIYNVLKGKIKQTSGFSFRYVDDNINNNNDLIQMELFTNE